MALLLLLCQDTSGRWRLRDGDPPGGMPRKEDGMAATTGLTVPAEVLLCPPCQGDEDAITQVLPV